MPNDPRPLPPIRPTSPTPLSTQRWHRDQMQAPREDRLFRQDVNAHRFDLSRREAQALQESLAEPKVVDPVAEAIAEALNPMKRELAGEQERFERVVGLDIVAEVTADETERFKQKRAGEASTVYDRIIDRDII